MQSKFGAMTEFKFRSHRHVLNFLQKWLLQLHGDEACPNLQSDAHDIEYLLSLKLKNEESERNVIEEIKLKNAHIHSINTYVEELRILLKTEDVSLDKETWKQIDSIAVLATKMNLEELDLMNFLLAFYNMKNETFKSEELRMTNCAMMSSYSQHNLKIRKSNDILKSQLDALKEVVDTQESNKVKIGERMKFFNAKSTEYECNSKSHKDRLKSINFEESLQHSNLVKWSEVIKVLEEELKVSKEKLKHYKNLPPNESLARLKIEEKKEELKQLEKEFASMLVMWENRTDNIDSIA